ncbi:MAG: hypothetical protein WAZ18_06275 [Alphaproteobacteria bacterium]
MNITNDVVQFTISTIRYFNSDTLLAVMKTVFTPPELDKIIQDIKDKRLSVFQDMLVEHVKNQNLESASLALTVGAVLTARRMEELANPDQSRGVVHYW